MKIDKFLVREGSKVNLKNHPTDFTGDYSDKEKAAKELEKNVRRIGELQDVMYAQDVYSLLIIFQAMDAAGKDSTIEHVMTGINPQGCSVVSFKQPSSEELDHDFLWRCANAAPERGKIGIFNRSHYEEVLVVRVHPQILQSQRLPDKVKSDKKIWSNRFKQIRSFEDNLFENGTHILKFFLNVSKDEHRGTRKKLEILSRRRQGTRPMARLYERIHRRDPEYVDQKRAVVHNSGRQEMVHAARRFAGDRR